MFIDWKTHHCKYIQFYQHLLISLMKSHSKSQYGGEMCKHMCVIGQVKTKQNS